TVLAVVDRLLASADELAVRSGLFVLRYFDEATALPRLTWALGKRAPEVRRMAARSLASLARSGSPEALGALSDAAIRSGPVEDSGDDLALAPLAAPLEVALAALSADT